MSYLPRTEIIEYIEGYLGYRLTSPETIADEALRDFWEALPPASSEDAHEELVDEILELRARVGELEDAHEELVDEILELRTRMVELENALEEYKRPGVNAPGGEAKGV